MNPDTTFFEYFRSYNPPGAGITPTDAPVAPAADMLGDSTAAPAVTDAGVAAPSVAPAATE